MYKRILGASAVGFGAFTWQADPKEYAYKRPILFWGTLVPIFAHYKFVEYKTKDMTDDQQTEIFSKLHVKYAPKVLDLVFTLRGLFIKFGQVACSRPDVLPQEYRDVFKVLLDNAPHVEGQAAINMAENALNCKLDTIFSYFDPIPLGAASIGQVHAATLKNGKQVVVKIQFPETQKAFELDFINGRTFAKIARPDQMPFMDEFEKQFKMEFDFAREARMLKTIGDTIHPHFKNVRIPIPYLEYCTPKCIVMERFYGQKLMDGFTYRMNENAVKMGFKDVNAMRQGFDDLKNYNTFHYYTTIFYKSCRFYLLNGVDLFKSFYNITLGHLFPKFYFNKWHNIDSTSIVKTIFRVHGHQIFRNGLFNADPHIGNIWLLDDNTIGLLDYGQVKELSLESIALLKQLYNGILRNDQDMAVNAYLEMGYSSSHNNKQIIFEKMVFSYDREEANYLKKMNFRQYMDYLEKSDQTKTVAQDAIMVMRTSFLLRGLGAMLTGIKYSTADMWREYLK